MTAGTYHFAIERGTDCVLPIEYTDGTGAPIDLTGCSAALMIRRAYDDPDPLVSLSTAAGGISINGAAGTVLVTIDATVTAELAPGPAVYDLKLTDSLGSPVLLVKGHVIVLPTVTR